MQESNDGCNKFRSCRRVKDPMNRARKSQARFAMRWSQVHSGSKVGFKSSNVALGSHRPEYPKGSSGEGGVGVPNTAIRIRIRKAGRRPINSRNVEDWRGGQHGL